MMKNLLFIFGVCLVLVGCQQNVKTNSVVSIKDTTTKETIQVVESDGFTEVEYLNDDMDRGHHEFEGTVVVDTSYYKKHQFQRGEVVYYDTPKTGRKNIARVVGLPGEKVEIKKGQLFINDKKVDSFYAKTMNRGISSFSTYKKTMIASGHEIIGEKEWKNYFERNLKSVVIKENEVFLLADNGWRAQDSFEFGPFLQDSVEGKVLGIAKAR